MVSPELSISLFMIIILYFSSCRALCQFCLEYRSGQVKAAILAATNEANDMDRDIMLDVHARYPQPEPASEAIATRIDSEVRTSDRQRGGLNMEKDGIIFPGSYFLPAFENLVKLAK